MEVVGWWVLCVAVWLASLTTVSAAEIVVAVSVAVPCAWVARLARRQVAHRWRFHARFFAGGWRLPVDVVATTGRVWWAAARRETGRVREVRVGSEAERAVRVALLSASPGQVVVDRGDGVLGVHTLGEDR